MLARARIAAHPASGAAPSQAGLPRLGARIMQRNHALPMARYPLPVRYATAHPMKPFEEHRHSKPYPASLLTRVWSSGMNRLGQLGTGDTPHQNHYVPVPITTLDGKEIVLAGCGTSHAIAFSSKGEMFAWGAGKHMQLGTKTAKDEFQPVLVPDAAQYFSKDRPIQALGNGVTSVVLTEQGNTFIWGTSERIDAVRAEVAPYVPLQGREPIASVAVGWGHYVACTQSGQLLTWGWNQHGQLGTGGTENQKLPKPLHAVKDRIVQVAAGQDHSIAVTDGGEVYVWGSCQHGQLGLEREVESVPVPRKLALPERIVQAACGMSHTLLRSGSGNVYSFGWNTSGQTGHIDGGSVVLAPARLEGLDGTAVRVAAGRLQSAAITEQLHAWVWGHCLAIGVGGGQVQPEPECLEEFDQPHINILDAVCGYDFSLFVTHEMPKA